MPDVALINHVVIAEAFLTDVGDSADRLAVQLRDGGDLGVITGAPGDDVLLTSDSRLLPLPDSDTPGPLVCHVVGGKVTCRAPDGREIGVTILPRQADVFDRVRGIFETDVLRGSGAAVLGLGSGGSFIARELAKGRRRAVLHPRRRPS